MGKNSGFVKSVGALSGGIKKKAGMAAGINAGVKKIEKGGKAGLALAKGAKVGAMAKKAGGIGFKKGAVVAGKVAGGKKVITGKAVKG